MYRYLLLFIIMLLLIGVLWIPIQAANPAPRSDPTPEPDGKGLSQQPEHQFLAEVLGSNDLRISVHDKTGLVRFIGATPQDPIEQDIYHSQSLSPAMASNAFMMDFGYLFGIQEPGKQLQVQDVNLSESGLRTVRYQQVHQGYPVYAGELFVQLNPVNDVVAAGGETLPLFGETFNASVPQEKASEFLWPDKRVRFSAYEQR